jgi:hypothetical protein
MPAFASLCKRQPPAYYYTTGGFQLAATLAAVPSLTPHYLHLLLVVRYAGCPVCRYLMIMRDKYRQGLMHLLLAAVRLINWMGVAAPVFLVAASWTAFSNLHQLATTSCRTNPAPMIRWLGVYVSLIDVIQPAWHQACSRTACKQVLGQHASKLTTL